MTTAISEREESQPSILSYLRDLPNLCSLGGLACTILAIYFVIQGVYEAAMIGMVWAVAFDWADGLIARRMKGRTGNDRKFGVQIDGLIDIVSYGVTPAILILCYGNFDPILLPVAFIIISASALRLSYFAIFGLSDESFYTGLALDNNNLILVLVFMLEGFFAEQTFLVILCSTALGLSALNVSRIMTPKLSGNRINVFILAAYTLAVTGIYGWRLY